MIFDMKEKERESKSNYTNTYKFQVIIIFWVSVNEINYTKRQQ